MHANRLPMCVCVCVFKSLEYKGKGQTYGADDDVDHHFQVKGHWCFCIAQCEKTNKLLTELNSLNMVR